MNPIAALMMLAVVAIIILIFYPPKDLRDFWSEWNKRQKAKEELRETLRRTMGYDYAKKGLAEGRKPSEIEAEISMDPDAFDYGMMDALRNHRPEQEEIHPGD